MIAYSCSKNHVFSNVNGLKCQWLLKWQWLLKCQWYHHLVGILLRSRVVNRHHRAQQTRRASHALGQRTPPAGPAGLYTNIHHARSRRECAPQRPEKKKIPYRAKDRERGVVVGVRETIQRRNRRRNRGGANLDDQRKVPRERERENERERKNARVNERERDQPHMREDCVHTLGANERTSKERPNACTHWRQTKGLRKRDQTQRVEEWAHQVKHTPCPMVGS